MNDLRQFYLESLEGKIGALELALKSLEQGRTDREDTISRVAHQLKGSGASYGMPAITDCAMDVLDASDRNLGAATRCLIDLLKEIVSGAAALQTILVVEHDPAMQILVQQTLESPERDIILASTLLVGLESVALDPDLVIFELTLPDGDGRHLLTDLRRQSGTVDTKTIVLSGADTGMTRAACLALGADEFLSKPFDPRSLESLVESLLAVDAGPSRSGGQTGCADRG